MKASRTSPPASTGSWRASSTWTAQGGVHLTTHGRARALALAATIRGAVPGFFAAAAREGLRAPRPGAVPLDSRGGASMTLSEKETTRELAAGEESVVARAGDLRPGRPGGDDARGRVGGDDGRSVELEGPTSSGRSSFPPRSPPCARHPRTASWRAESACRAAGRSRVTRVAPALKSLRCDGDDGWDRGERSITRGCRAPGIRARRGRISREKRRACNLPPGGCGRTRGRDGRDGGTGSRWTPHARNARARTSRGRRSS